MVGETHQEVALPTVGSDVDGELLGTWYRGEGGTVLFVHGSGSSRRSSRNLAVAEYLNGAGFATLLVDLLTVEEQRVDDRTRQLRFDIELLTRRVVGALDWLGDRESESARRGLLGASTGAAAALGAAVRRPDHVGAVVSRGGRPDLSPDALADVHAPTVFIVGGADEEVLALNRQAEGALAVEHELAIVPGATHLFEEPGALEQVADIATGWFRSHLH